MPPRKVLHPLPEASKNWGSTQNLLLQGDNIDALRLLRQSYFGQVKLIYIDPPYNTQSDAFIYRDNFTQKQEQVLEQLGYSKENSEYIKNIYGARTHSGWLSFMYPRLLLAKDMLRDDGVIFISIDDNEQAQLKLLCDEVFGQDNFVATIPWRKRTAKSDVPFGVSQDFEWLVCYAKEDFLAGQQHERKYYQTPDYPNDRWRLSDLTKQTSAGERINSAFDMVNPKNGETYPFNPKRSWSITKETFPEHYQKGKIVFPGDYDFLKITIPAYRVFESEDKAKALQKYGSEQVVKALSTQLPKEVGLSEHGNKDFEKLFDAKFFAFPKPVALITHILAGCSSEDDLIMDFFAGSGTTAEAVMRLNAEDGGQRRFILVQIPQPIDAKKQKEAHQFVQTTLGKAEPTIFDITAERIRRAGQKVSDECAAAGKPAPDVGFQVYAIDEDCGGLLLGNNLGKNLADAEQGDLLSLQQSIHTPQADDMPRVLANLLLAEGLPLTAHIHTVRPHCLYWAQDARADAGAGTGTLLVLQGIKLMELADELDVLAAQGKPVTHCCIFTPWVQDDGLLHGIKTLLEDRGLGAERLRLRG